MQFYYEFEVKLKNELKNSGENWKLKISMKENLLRIAEKIEGYMNPPKKEEVKEECKKDAENAGHHGEEDEEARDLEQDLKIIADKLEGH